MLVPVVKTVVTRSSNYETKRICGSFTETKPSYVNNYLWQQNRNFMLPLKHRRACIQNHTMKRIHDLN